MTIFVGFIENLTLKNYYYFPTHSIENGKVEAINWVINQLLKARLEKAKGHAQLSFHLSYSPIKLL